MASRVIVEIALGAVWIIMLPPPSTGLCAVTSMRSSSCARRVSYAAVVLEVLDSVTRLSAAFFSCLPASCA